MKLYTLATFSKVFGVVNKISAYRAPNAELFSIRWMLNFEGALRRTRTLR